VLSGLAPEAVLRGIDRVLRHERVDPYSFATVCDVTIAPYGETVVVRRHGHHPPLLVAPVVGWLESTTPATPLGAFDHTDAAAIEVPLPPGWAMLLTTDGLHEAPSAAGRLGEDRLVDAVAAIDGWLAAPEKAMDDLLNVVTEAEAAHLVDDVALLWLGATNPR
jgi:serine phosphatase RsbU (regulator of sigma subunit)